MRLGVRFTTLVFLCGLYGCDSGLQVSTGGDEPRDLEAVSDRILEPVIGAANGDVSEVGQWGGVLDWPHVAVSMANLPDGRILTYSGSERRTWPTTEQTYSATWNPQSGEFIENLHRGHNMFCAAMSMTSDGKVLVNGGRNQGNSPWTTLFDYRDNQWQQIENMASGGRWYPSTLAMGDGKVLTGLGQSTNTRNPDLWDPTDGWRVLNGIDFINMRQRNNERGRENSFPLLSLAPNGNVYHYWDVIENQMISTAGNGSTRPANPTTDGINHAGGVQVMYDAGKLLISGRNDGSWGGNALGADNSAFTVDLNGGVPDIRAIAPMNHRRKFHQLIPLPTGEVLVVGGNTTGAKFQDNGSVMEPEIWNPQTGQWRRVANMSVPRDYHSTALLMTDGRVLTAGGGYDAGNPNSSGTHQDAQIFSPPYLFKNGAPATRPTLVSDQGIADTGTSIDVSTSGDIAYFSFIRMSATTHAMNTDARFYKPAFTANGSNRYQVEIHPNPNVATPGYWMLFAVDTGGVPSLAQVIRVTALDTRLDNLAPAGIATQSSTVDNTFAAANAIDQDLSGNQQAGSLSQTNSEMQSWWQLDLGRVVEIDTIRLWNRTDCCSDQLSDFHVLVSSRPFASTDLATTLAQTGVINKHIPGTAGLQTDVGINALGRYVRVQLSAVKSLHLAEVQVFGSPRSDLSNVALEGVATQSSNYDDVSLAGVAIDGSTSGDASNDGSAQTLGGNGGGPFTLACPAGQVLAGMYGSTGTYVNSVGPRCVAVDVNGNWLGQPQNRGRRGGTGGAGYSRTCPGGQAVTGFTFKGSAYVNQIGLQCRELVSAVATGGGITDLSVVGSNNGPAQGPLDCGNTAATGLVGRSGSWMDAFGLQCPAQPNGVITHTNEDLNSWWELDLGRVVDIDSVVLWNRSDCCSDRLSDFYLFVSDSPFSSKALATTNNQAGVVSRFFQGAAGRSEELAVGTTGRYLRVQLAANSQFLSLAEVQVMAAEVAMPLEVQPISLAPVPTGTAVSLSAVASGSGGLEYQWNFGDGSADTAFSASPSINYAYAAPGRYVVSLTVRDASGDEVRQTYTQIIHPPILSAKPVASSGMVEHSSRDQLWNVNPDNNSVSVIATDTLALTAEIAVGRNPVSLAEAPNGDVWVVNRDSATVDIISSDSLSISSTISLTRASQPYGIVFDDNAAYVALEAVGQVVKVSAAGAVLDTVSVGTSPRHVSLDATGQKLYVSRFISPPLPGEDTANPIVDDGTRKYGGEVLVLDTAGMSIEDTIVLEHSNKVASEHEGPGIPNYLGAVAISPAGNMAWVPSKQDNILAGGVRGGDGITFDQSVRAITSRLDLAGNTEVLADRVDHDNASVASSAVYDPFGVTLFTSLEGNRQISIIDVDTAIEIGRFDTGRAPQAMAMSADGTRLYVHNFMDRSVGVYDVESIVRNGSTDAVEVATINVVSNEQLEATVLRGKQLFYDARDDRLAGLDYMSCASCHTDGEHDGRVWDFTTLGEGLRNTITLKGRAGMGHGLLHWTGNFDELQDFEGQIRSFAGGSGLMNDADFARAQAPLGNPKAGLSTDLDALAAYMTSLDKVADSPWRNADGSLTTNALNGEALFTSKNCAGCHSGEVYTDSATAALHDVGTIMADSGSRLDAALTGLDTPTLRGVWRTAPYLHDGSAATLQDAIAAHVDVDTTVSEQDQLAAYLAQLDHSAESLEPPVDPGTPPPPNTFSNLVSGTALTLDGVITDWSGLNSFGSDADDASDNNSIDWREAWFAHDSDYYYIAYRNDGPVVPAWGYGLYIDIDGDKTTGFSGFGAELPTGADYLLEGGTLQQYTGTGNDWAWQSVGSVAYQVNGNTAELAIPRALLGNANVLRVYFRGDNGAVGADTIDYYPDAVLDSLAADSERYFIYSTAAANGNTPPVALSQNIAVASGESVPITLAGADVDSDTLSYELIDLPAQGSVSGTPPAISYAPDPGYAGTDTFTFTVNDGSATSSAATITVFVDGGTNSSQANITVDGSLTDWSAVASFGVDPLDANESNDSIDITQGWMAHDNQNVYIAYQNETPVTLGWGYAVYLDTDNNASTGFRGFGLEFPIGADYLIEGAEVARYTGSGTNWSWTQVLTADSAVAGVNVELALPRSVLGDPQSLHFFMVGENASVDGPSTDYYPDNVTSIGSLARFFSYVVDGMANNLPVAVGQVLATPVNTPLNILLAGSDADGEALGFQITRQPANGSLTGTAPDVIYTPDNTFNGVDTFAFRVNDAAGSSEPAVVSINVGSRDGVYSNLLADINLDGSLDDWAGVDGFLPDADDILSDREQIDWRQAWMAHNSGTLFVAVQNDGRISALTYGHALYLDTDTTATTGFRGFSGEFATGTDYLLEGTDLYEYSGSGNNWSWTYVATVRTAVVNGVAEYAIPRDLIGASTAIDVYWRGDNGAIGGSGLDFYPDAVTNSAADSAARRFRYSM